MSDKEPDNISGKDLSEKKAHELGNFLAEFAPSVEMLSKDPSLTKKQRNECRELLEMKKEFDKTGKDFISKYTHNPIALAFAWWKLNEFKHDLAEPFSKELINKTVKDVWDSAESDDWNRAMQDVKLLHTLHEARDRKTMPQMVKQDIEKINEKLQANGWLPDVKLVDRELMTGRNLSFTVDKEKFWIVENGDIKLVQDKSGEYHGVPNIPSVKFGQYLKVHRLKIVNQLNDETTPA